MIKAIIFDCFGVLTEDAWLDFNKKYYGTDTYKIAHEYNGRVDHGLISNKELYQKLAKLLNKTEAEVEKVFTSERKHRELFEYIEKDLKPRFKIGMLSNVNRGFLDKFLSDTERSLFDSVIVSGEIGVAKPDPAAYKSMLGDLSVEPSQAVMIDDRQYNVDGAKNIGMHGILYKDFDQLKTDLNKILAEQQN